jgi:hypothetical protein
MAGYLMTLIYKHRPAERNTCVTNNQSAYYILGARDACKKTRQALEVLIVP